MTEFIGEFIFSSGNWGSAKEHVVSTFVRDAQTISNSKLYKLNTFKRKVFPSKDYMKASYPVLRKHAYLLPFYYMIRITKTLIHHPGNAKKYLNGFLFVDTDSVKSREQALTYVGLAFHFKEKE